MSRFALSRRTFLRGAGAMLALPTLDAMLDGNGEALADGGGIPRRFATFFFGNGVRLDRWVPSTTGVNWPLSEQLAPLAPVKDYVNLVTGYTVQAAGPRGHHGGMSGMLSGVEFIPLDHPNSNYSSKFGGPSIDQIVADYISGGTTTRSLELGVSQRYVTGEGPTLQFISHRGPDLSLAPDYNPANVFTRLFDSYSPPSDPRSRLRASILDAVRDDVNSLKTRLGANDRRRLDAHLTAIAELRGRILSLPPVYTGACQPFPAVSNTNQDMNGLEPLDEVMDIQADLLAMAWACDLTRVASIMYTGSVCYTVFDMVGATTGHHDLTHDMSPGAQELVHQCTVHTVDAYSKLLQKLKAMPEGAGNLLDNSLVLLTTDCDEGLTHNNNDYPIVLGGKAGGAMKYPGIHHRGQPGLTNTSDVLLSILSAMGTPVTDIGVGSSASHQRCAPILA